MKSVERRYTFIRTFHKALLFLFVFCVSTQSYGQYKKKGLVSYIHTLEDLGYFVSYDPDAVADQKILIPKKVKEENSGIWIQLSSVNKWEFIVSQDSSVFVRKKPDDLSDFHCFKVKDKDTQDYLSGFTYEEHGRVKAGTHYGYFSLYGDVSDSVSIFHQDYGKHNFEIKEQEGCQEILLSFLAIDLEAVDISIYITHGIEESSDDHSIVITPEDLALVPGQEQGDVLQALSLLPGVNSASGGFSSMSIRGSIADQNLMLVDDIPVYYSGHVFGTVSPYISELMSNISVARDGGGLAEIDKLGGLVNMKILEQKKDSIKQGVNVNSTFSSYTISGPLLKDKLDFAFGIRSAYPFNWTSPRLEAARDVGFFGGKMTVASILDSIQLDRSYVYFGDVTSKLKYHINDNYEIEVSGLTYLTSFGFDLIDYNRDESDATIRHYRNDGLKTRIKRDAGDKVVWDITGTYSNFRFDQSSQIESFSGDQALLEDDAGLRDLRLSYNLSWDLSEKHQLDGGLAYNAVFTSESIVNRATGEADQRQRQGLISSLYIQDKWEWSDRMVLFVGAKINKGDFESKYRILPRIKLISDLTDQLRFNLSTGVLNQFVHKPIVFDFNDSRSENETWILSQNDTDVQQAEYVSAGFVWRHKGLMCEIEGYYKNVSGIIYSYEVMVPNQGTIEGGIPSENLIGGLDFVCSYNTDRISLWGKYSYSSVKWQLLNLDDPFSAYFEQPHVLSIGASKTMKNLTFSMGWSLKSGVPDQEVNVTGVATGPGPGGPRAIDPYVDYNGRVSPFHQLDVSAAYDVRVKAESEMKIGFAVLNVYDQENNLELFQPGGAGGFLLRNTTRISPEVFLRYKF